MADIINGLAGLLLASIYGLVAYQDFKYRKVNKFLLSLMIVITSYSVAQGLTTWLISAWYWILIIITVAAMLKGKVEIPPADVIVFYTSAYVSILSGIISLIYNKITKKPSPFIGFTALIWMLSFLYAAISFLV